MCECGERGGKKKRNFPGGADPLLEVSGVQEGEGEGEAKEEGVISFRFFLLFSSRNSVRICCVCVCVCAVHFTLTLPCDTSHAGPAVLPPA